MLYFLYILLCDNQFFYVGITNNLDRRLEQHQAKHSKFTKRYKVIKHVYTEQFEKRTQAEKREKQIKGWSKAKKQALIENNIEKLIILSKSKS